MSTEAIARPAAPSPHDSVTRSRHGARPSRHSSRTTSSAITASDTGRMAEIQTPERPLAGSSSAALATVSVHAGPIRATKSASSTRRRPRSTAARRRGSSRRTTAVTRGCCDCLSAATPPTHISHTRSRRATSSVQGIGWCRMWRPITCRPTTTAWAATRAPIARSRPRSARERTPGVIGALTRARPRASRPRRARALHVATAPRRRAARRGRRCRESSCLAREGLRWPTAPRSAPSPAVAPRPRAPRLRVPDGRPAAAA